MLSAANMLTTSVVTTLFSLLVLSDTMPVYNLVLFYAILSLISLS